MGSLYYDSYVSNKTKYLLSTIQTKKEDELRIKPDSSRQGQAQEFGILTLFYGLWTSSMDKG